MFHNNIRKSEKVKKATEFVERIIKVHEEVGVALKKAQEDMKRQVDRRRKESKDWKKENKVMLSTKDLVFKERPVRKLVERYVGPYKIEEVVLTNAIKLWLPKLMRIHPVVNISQVVWYRKQVKSQKKEEEKPVEVEGIEEWEVEKILNKRKIRGVERYLVWWKGFIVEHNTWKKKEDLEDAREVLEKFEKRMNMEVRRQEKLDIAKERDFRKRELPGKFTAKMLYK